MRLLAKSEIVKSKSEDRAREIAEGLKLSRRVDSLRELQAREEAALEKWRKETIIVIHEEIEALQIERNAIAIEVDALRQEKARGLDDIDHREQEINAEWDNLNEARKVLELEVNELELGKKNLSEILKTSRDELERARTHREEAENIRKASQSEREESNLILISAQQTHDQVLALKESVEKALSLREQTVTNREQSVALREDKVRLSAGELRIKELQLIDREETLDREIQRQKRNG